MSKPYVQYKKYESQEEELEEELNINDTYPRLT
jgi:hypothetical protein